MRREIDIQTYQKLHLSLFVISGMNYSDKMAILSFFCINQISLFQAEYDQSRIFDIRSKPKFSF